MDPDPSVITPTVILRIQETKIVCFVELRFEKRLKV